uniref:Uncharacterized protein n=1 Tax=Sinocyclocheilus anshuiensis TaxID=1608454 RepID=A0A671QJV8_9TELE
INHWILQNPAVYIFQKSYILLSNLLTDPVSTTCGHTFCKDCLDKHISITELQCPLCQEPVTTKPSINEAIEALLREFRQTQLPNLDLFCGERDAIPCDVCDEHLTFKAVKSCLICLLSFCDEHLKPHQSMARFKGHKLVNPVEKLDQRACNTHGRPLQLYCRRDERCICALCVKTGGDVVPVESERERRQVRTYSCRETTQIFSPELMFPKKNKDIFAILHQLKKKKHTPSRVFKEQQEIQEVFAALMEVLGKAEEVLLAPLEDGRRLNVTLDAETAHPHLEVSADGKNVRDSGASHDIPGGPQQFDLVGGVLGNPCITSGRAFWVVEVGNKVGWELGVMRDGANRKGKVSYKPSEGYWAIMLCAQNMYGAFEDPPLQLHLETKPQKLGVFVDCEEAMVSFYDMEALSHIYSFTRCSFNGAIRPICIYFKEYFNEQGAVLLTVISLNFY